MAKRGAVAVIGSGLLLLGCVTKTINSDGSVQSNVVDKAKLSETYVDLALEYQNHNAPQIALDRVNLAVKTQPSSARAYMVRAMIYAQLGKIDLAEADFKRALDLKDDYADAQVNYAVFLCNQQRYAEAAANFNAAMNNPLYFTPEMAYYSRGNCYYMQQQYESANADYLKALTYRNPPPDTYIALARLQFQQNNYVVANYYINKYNGTQTPAIMWLHIQILQGLLERSPDALRTREYTGYRNTLGQVLLKNYGDTYEAQQYLLRYTGSNKIASTKGAAASSAAVIRVKVNASVPQAVTSSVPGVGGKLEIRLDHAQRRYIVVKPGQTLYQISKSSGVSISRLQQINPSAKSGPKIGLRLYLDPK